MLKEAEAQAAAISRSEADHDIAEQISDRRHGDRVWVYLPVLVYGRTIESEPFHEGTEALRVNAGGGLITLTSAGSRGQRLLLIKKENQKHNKCHVAAE